LLIDAAAYEQDHDAAPNPAAGSADRTFTYSSLAQAIDPSPVRNPPPGRRPLAPDRPDRDVVETRR
jgi:hypothetical protein